MSVRPSVRLSVGPSVTHELKSRNWAVLSIVMVQEGIEHESMIVRKTIAAGETIAAFPDQALKFWLQGYFSMPKKTRMGHHLKKKFFGPKNGMFWPKFWFEGSKLPKYKRDSHQTPEVKSLVNS